MTLADAVASVRTLVVIPVEAKDVDSAIARVNEFDPTMLSGLVLACKTKQLATWLAGRVPSALLRVVSPKPQSVIRAAFGLGASSVLLSSPKVVWNTHVPAMLAGSELTMACDVTMMVNAAEDAPDPSMIFFRNTPGVNAALLAAGLSTKDLDVGLLPHSLVAPSFEAGASDPDCPAYKMA